MFYFPLFYNCIEKLKEAEHPEDRILMNYKLPNGSSVVDLAILPPGLSEMPMMIIEIKRNMIEGNDFLSSEQAEKIRKEYDCPGYVYCVDDKILYYLDNSKATGARSSFPTYDEIRNQWLKKQSYLSTLNLENFMIFKSAEFQFGSKLNIIIGENGSGKTQLLKVIYSIFRSLSYKHSTEGEMISSFLTSISNIFKVNNLTEFTSNSRTAKKYNIRINYTLSEGNKTTDLMIKTSEEKKLVEANISEEIYKFSANNATFLPPNELLSIFPGFSSMRQIYPQNWPYDRTISDCIDYLGLPPIQSQGNFFKEIIQEVEKAIHGHIYLDEQGTRFLMQMEKSKNIYEIPLVATGWRKLGQLLQLINTGAIYPGSILLWDEPDANQNPKLICLIAKVLMKLAIAGVQVFIATHSLFLLRELEYLSYEQNAVDSIRYIALGEEGVEQADNTAKLQTILSFEEEIKQEDRIIELERKRMEK